MGLSLQMIMIVMQNSSRMSSSYQLLSAELERITLLKNASIFILCTILYSTSFL